MVVCSSISCWPGPSVRDLPVNLAEHAEQQFGIGLLKAQTVHHAAHLQLSDRCSSLSDIAACTQRIQQYPGQSLQLLR